MEIITIRGVEIRGRQTLNYAIWESDMGRFRVSESSFCEVKKNDTRVNCLLRVDFLLQLYSSEKVLRMKVISPLSTQEGLTFKSILETDFWLKVKEEERKFCVRGDWDDHYRNPSELQRLF
jgi:hypothetical protein